MSKPTEQCPGCNDPRAGISEGIAYFKCGSYYEVNNNRMIFQSEACKKAVPEGLFSQGEAQ